MVTRTLSPTAAGKWQLPAASLDLKCWRNALASLVLLQMDVQAWMAVSILSHSDLNVS